MTPEEMEEAVRRREPVLRFLHHVLRWRRFGGGRGSAGNGRGARARQRADAMSSTRSSCRSRMRTTARRAGCRCKHDGHTRTVDVRIPAGVGRRIASARVAERVNKAAGGAPRATCILRVRLAPHPLFERKGRDLYAKVPVPVTTAVARRRGRGRPTSVARPARLRDSATDTERPGVSSEGIRHADDGQAGGEAAISTPGSRCRCRRRCRRGARALRGARKDWQTHGQDAQRGLSRRL